MGNKSTKTTESKSHRGPTDMLSGGARHTIPSASRAMTAGRRGSEKLRSEFCFFVTSVGIHRNHCMLEANVRSECGEIISGQPADYTTGRGFQPHPVALPSRRLSQNSYAVLAVAKI